MPPTGFGTVEPRKSSVVLIGTEAGDAWHFTPDEARRVGRALIEAADRVAPRDRSETREDARR